MEEQQNERSQQAAPAAEQQGEPTPETPETGKRSGKRAEKSDAGTELYFWGQALTLALVVLVCMNTWFFRLSGVRGSSMEPTFQGGDQVIMRVIAYDQPERGDVVVVASDYFPDEPLFKRVIGLAGDVIDFDTDAGVLILNGERQYEPYLGEPIARFGNQSYPYTVPEGCVFVMGDNRNGSTDSRVKEVGALPCSNVVGKVLLRIWPLSSFGPVA